MDKKGDIEINLLKNKPFIVIKDFYIPQKPKRDTSKRMVLFTFLGLILGIIVVFVIALIKKLENYQKS
jgi:hypothetical protein